MSIKNTTAEKGKDHDALTARLLPKLIFKSKKKADDGVLMSAAMIADLHVDGDTSEEETIV